MEPITSTTISSTLQSNTSEEENSIICGFTEECDFRRFFFITVLSCIAFVGACCNFLLAWIFIRYRFNNLPPTLYPTFLAILDGLICCFYVMLFGVDAVHVYLRIESLFIIYHVYIVPSFVLSKITQLAIPYLLIFVTLERLAWISENFKNFCLFSTMGRPISVVCCLIICVMLRSPPLWALTVEHFPRCPDFFRSLAVAPTEWAMESELYAFYDFWLMAFIQTLLPFMILVFTNIIIVKKLSAVYYPDRDILTPQAKSSEATLVAFPSTAPRRSIHKLSFGRMRMPVEVRNAVYTTLAIVASYLVCNSLHLVLTVLERSKSSLLDDAEDSTKASAFYTLFGDSVSAFYMVTSAGRILIYCKCNPVINSHVKRILNSCSCRGSSKDKTSGIKYFDSVERKSVTVDNHEPVDV
ncbi:hypothetical protein FO519_004835 [Halicephalobus sp. NKZ332]|nr:hypothetical protein FO519_004835 [Halicephalobus sp. NKZ332]